MKYKLLSKEQILISLDRLTRFKFTKEKYVRVFSDIITSSLIEPVYKKRELENLAPEELTDLAQTILNASLKEITESDKEADENINKQLAEYENQYFNTDEYTNKLLNNTINYSLGIELITEDSPINLRWLKELSSSDNLEKIRYEKSLKFPIKKVILAEGLTEEILLPAFSKYLNFDFDKMGIHLIPAGGKNQVVKLYYKLSEELKLPIFLLLDRDAEENIAQIKPKLRSIDKIHLVSSGEFEDLLPKSLIVKTVNNHLSNFASINENDLTDDIPEVKNLENIFKTIGLHEFKKAEFAKLVKENITEDSDISPEIAEIIMELSL